MAAYSVTVRPYNSAGYKAVLRVRRPGQKPERQFFKSIKEAEAEKAAKLVEIQQVGLDALSIDSRTRLEVIGAIEKLKPFEVTLTRAVDFFVEHHRASATVKEACDLYIASRKGKGWSVRHKRNLQGIIAGSQRHSGTRLPPTCRWRLWRSGSTPCRYLQQA